MKTQWRFRHAGRTLGPYPWPLLVQLHRRGTLRDDTLVQPANSAQWLPMRQVLDAQAGPPFPAGAAAGKGRLHLRLLLFGLIPLLALLIAFYWVMHSVRDDIDPRPWWLALAMLSLLIPLWYALTSLWLWTASARQNSFTGRDLPRLAMALTGALLLFTLYSNYRPLQALVGIATQPDRYGQFAIGFEDGGRSLVYSGPFGYAAPARLQEELARHPRVDRVVFDSPGGWMVAGRGIARVLAQARIQTAVVRHRCASACTLAFESVPHRVLEADAALGFHSESNQFSWAASEHANDSFAEVFAARGMPQAFIDRAIATPSSTLWWPDTALLLRNRAIDSVRLDGRDLAAADYFPAVVDRYFAGPEFAPLAKGLRQFAPAHLQKLRQDVAALLQQDALDGQIGAVTQQAINADEQLALQRAGDTAQLEHAALMLQLLQEFNARAPELCYSIWTGRNAAAVNRAFTPAEQGAFLRQMGGMLQAAAQDPLPPPSDADGADLVAQATRSAYLKYGDAVYDVPLALSQGRVTPAMVCDMAQSTYRRIHAMRPAEAGAAMRWLALGKSPGGEQIGAVARRQQDSGGGA